MQKPTMRVEIASPSVRIAIVTMDSHLADSATGAAAILRPHCPGLAVSVHAADEWGSDPLRLAACHEAIARADIVIATMLFLDEHIQAVLPALAARRDGCDAMLCALSAGEVVRLTRLGRFSMASEAGGALAMLKRLRGTKGRNGAPASGRDQMKMLRRLPKILRFIPGAAQDARAYFLGLQYWLAGSEANLVQLMRMLIDRYAAGPRASLRGTLPASAPRDYPDVGVYHPSVVGRLSTDLAALPAAAPGCKGTVGLLLMRSYLLAGNTDHYDGVIRAFEGRGLRVVPAFASGLDQRPAIETFFMADGVASVDAVVSLTGFSLVGGPAYNDAKAAEEMLARLDVPYVAAHPVEFQTLEQWRDDKRGLLPVEAAMMVAIPELDGAVWPMTFGGRSSGAGENRQRRMEHEPERATRLAARVGALVALRRSSRATRRVAVVLFGFPPNAGAVGTAAHLSVFASLHNTLAALARAGYDVEVPPSVDALRETVLGGDAPFAGTDANVHARIPVADHLRREPHLREIEQVWGPAPGRHGTDGASLLVLGARFGNVFVGVQPALGTEGDPMRLLFEQGFAPTHAFSAFYRWVREDFAADAVLHFGTHGGLEFMPGKHAGLSEACWPDRLIGDLPHVYLYAANNPSEGLLARRRAGAVLVSYMTPPLGTAGLYRGLLDLKASIDRWRALPPEADRAEREALERLIGTEAEAVDLDASDGIDGLRLRLIELEETLIPNGLHVVGNPPDAAARTSMLDAAGIDDPDRRATLDALLATDHEIPALIHALDGGYIRPVAGGDFLRNPDMLPTGRNLHGLDPFRIPSAFAREDGARQAERLLLRHREGGNAAPETIAMVLWGIDNLKTEGGPLAQALWLIGAEPRHDSYGRVAGATLVPLPRLGRARVDVVVTLSGIFRDLMPLQVKLLAEAAFLAASADDEPEEMNPIRRHALAFQRAHGGSLEDASLRVFGNASDAYGSNVNQMVDAGTWDQEDELADVFVRRKGHAYGRDGAPKRDTRLFEDMLGRVDLSYQNLDSVDLGVTTIDHYFDTLGGIGRAVTRARGGTKAPIYIGDQTRGAAGVVRTLAEQVTIETRTRTLNPVFVEAMLAHGGEGVRHLECAVTNTLGWSATTGEVETWVYRGITETFVEDTAMRDRLLALNPLASSRLVNRLIEAGERKYWSPDQATLDRLYDARDLIEDRVEGIVAGDGAGLVAMEQAA